MCSFPFGKKIEFDCVVPTFGRVCMHAWAWDHFFLLLVEPYTSIHTPCDRVGFLISLHDRVSSFPCLWANFPSLQTSHEHMRGFSFWTIVGSLLWLCAIVGLMRIELLLASKTPLIPNDRRNPRLLFCAIVGLLRVSMRSHGSCPMLVQNSPSDCLQSCMILLSPLGFHACVHKYF